MASPQESAEWRALVSHQVPLSQQNLRQLFTDNPDRFGAFSLHAAGLMLDYSKHLITAETVTLLTALAERCGLPAAIEAMFEGESINNTERRPALHVALRSPALDSVFEKAVHETLDRMERFVTAVLEQAWLGYTDKPITDVVNLGIGGSDLGPAMVYEALTGYHQDEVRCHFVSNVDPGHIEQTLADLDPETTLFIIASKSFTTLETAQNALAARRWFMAFTEDKAALARHFVAISANVEKAEAFGIDPENIFPIWDWVGGRYSLWSAIGLPVALGIGMQNFRALLAGAHAMDSHFRTAPLPENMPVMMALLAVWYLNFFGAESQAVLPYHQNLHLFPAFLQQLDMESLGKSVTREGFPVTEHTGGIVWGSAGTNGQHSFHQLLHQGTHLVPADFIAVAGTDAGDSQQYLHLLANCFAQSQALMDGKTLAQARAELIGSGMSGQEADLLAPHKAIPGNRPSSTIMMKQLSPESLGSLIAAYEHKVYVQSVILNINAFDQFGVELGKVLSNGIFEALNTLGETSAFDASTNALIDYCKKPTGS